MPPGVAPAAKPPFRVLLAGPDATVEGLVLLLLRARFTVATATSVAEVLPLLDRAWPHVLLLDLDLPDLTPAGLARITAQAPGVRGLGLHAAATRADLLQTARTRLQMLVDKPVDQAALLRTLATMRRELSPPEAPASPQAPASSPATPASPAAPAAPAPAPGSPALRPGARHVEGNRALLARDVQCPLHDQPVLLTHYSLRTGKVLTETSFFDLPVYTGATRDADFCNYHLLAVLVCPDCLFASGNPDYFIRLDARGRLPSELSDEAQAALRDGAAQRRASAGALQPTFHTHQRTLDEALLAQQLALEGAATCLAVDSDTYAIEMARAANYHLRAALLLELRQAPGQSFKEAVQLTPPAQAIEHYRQALAQLKEAYVRLKGPALYKTMYQLAAVGIFLGEDEAAHRAIECLRRLQDKRDLPGADRPLIARYLNRCQTAWEDRDLHRLAALAAA